MPTQEEMITGLTDRQALSILDSLAAEFASDDTPETIDRQVQVIHELLVRQGYTVNVAGAAQAETAAAAAAAQRLLVLMAQVPEFQPSLHERLSHPRNQQKAALELILAAPVVLSGYVVLLQVARHLRVRRHPDGRWEFDYDPARKVDDDTLTQSFLQTLAQIMGTISSCRPIARKCTPLSPIGGRSSTRTCRSAATRRPKR